MPGGAIIRSATSLPLLLSPLYFHPLVHSLYPLSASPTYLPSFVPSFLSSLPLFFIPRSLDIKIFNPVLLFERISNIPMGYIEVRVLSSKPAIRQGVVVSHEKDPVFRESRTGAIISRMRQRPGSLLGVCTVTHEIRMFEKEN